MLVLASTETGCVSISAFSSLVGFHVVIGSCVVASEICTIAAEINKYKSIIKKKILFE